MDDLLADFLTETNESLAELDIALVKLERTPDDQATLSLIFRLVHTIKGTCGFLGLPRLERVAHAGENVLGRVRDGLLTVTPDIISQVLAALDRIKMIVSQLAVSGSEPDGDDSDLIAALNELAAGAPAAPPAPPPAPVPPEVVAAAPAPVPAADIRPTEIVAITPPKPPARVENAVETVAPKPIPSTPLEPAAAAAEAAGQQTIRVTVDVLEDLMTLVSELVLTRNQLLQLARAQENSGFTVPLQRLSHITSDLQEGVMKTRMQPIGNAWNKLPRLVRDLARDLDKRIDMVMLGAETELDRQVLELIKDPLTHMVRNSADHGLESPAERRAAGKSETGQIRLNAFHEGGHIIIEIADDGRGLSLDRIRTKALSAGLATEAELATMSDQQLQRFIFRAGFSTAAAVTAVSGRGVGMDVVKTNIERIGGTIDVKSVAGQGSTFTIKIPLTLAIVSALIVEAGGERFAIPQISVMELVRADTDAGAANDRGTAGEAAGGAADGDAAKAKDPGRSLIERVNDTPVLRLRDRLLPLVNLNSLLQLGETATTSADAYIVVAQVGASMLGIIVDRVFDTEEIVVKPVAPILRHITMFSGNTILGDGSVIMILDPNGIARATGVGAVSDSNAADTKTHTGTAVALRQSQERTAMLLFRAGGPQPIAVPLGLVARLESVPRERIEASCGMPVTQYRGRLMPLVSLAGSTDASEPFQQVLVFADRDRCMGLMVDEIVDVVEDTLKIELSAARPGLLGSAVIAGQATDVIDTGYWLMQAWEDWFQGVAETAGETPRQVLVVEDSDFFRQLLVPSLAASGYVVTAAASAAEALAMRDAGTMFDAIVSDIEMPDMDGFDFARTVRAGGAWSALPLIALSGRTEPRDQNVARDAGFTDYVVKFQRDALVGRLHACLAA